MHVERYGTGRKAYFGLHGWAGGHQTFEPLLPYLPPDCSLYAADMPGYSPTPAPPEWNLDAVSKPIAEAASSLDCDSLTIIGNCGGGLFAMEAIKWHGLSPDRIVLIDAFAYVPWYFAVFTWGTFGRMAYLSTFANPLGRWLTNQSLSAKRAEKSTLTGSFAQLDHGVVYEHLCLMCALTDVEHLRGITCPLDLAYGERSFGAIKRSVVMWKDVLPQIRAFELTGAGHLPIQEATGQLARLIFDPPGEDEPL